MSTETATRVLEDFKEPHVTQDWETSARPEPFQLAQHLVELAVKAEEQSAVPPQSHPGKDQPTVAEVVPELVRQAGQYRVLEADGTLGDSWGGVGSARVKAAIASGKVVVNQTWGVENA